MTVTRFHDGRSAATHAAEPIVFGRELRVVDGADRTLAVWPVDAIRAEPDLDPDGMTVLTARDRPGVLSTADPALLDALRRAGVRLPMAHAWWTGHRWTRRHWAGIGGGFALALAAVVLALNALPHWIATGIPVSWERKLGEPMVALLTRGSPVCAGAEGQAALNRLVERLRASGRIAIPVELSVLNDGMVNAFTLPGGKILVMRGLIDDAEDGAVLAAVIAHELGHVTHRDSVTMLVRELGLQFILASLGIGDMGATAIGGASQLTALAYGRAAEAAADETAIDVLTAAGLRADGLSRFFAAMEKKRGRKPAVEGEVAPDNRTATISTWLSTHPPDQERRERTARPDIGEAPFSEAEWTAIKGMCARKSSDNGK